MAHCKAQPLLTHSETFRFLETSLPKNSEILEATMGTLEADPTSST